MLTTHKGHKVGSPSLVKDILHGFFSQRHSKTGTLACATSSPKTTKAWAYEKAADPVWGNSN